MKKFITILFLFLTNSFIFAQDGLLKDPTLTVRPRIGVGENLYQFKAEKENDLSWYYYTYGVDIQLEEKRTWVTLKGDLLMDRDSKETFQSFWYFSYDWRVFKSDKLFLQLKYEGAQEVPSTEGNVKFEGNFTTVGIHYNNVYHQREYDDLINLYAQVNYILAGNQMFLTKPYLRADFNESFETTFGVVINIADVLFVEQNAIIYTKPTGWITMSPYHSYFDTKAWVDFKNVRLGFKHTCFHTFDDKFDGFPEINGGQDSFFLEYSLSWENP